ncbi:MAG TPA: metallophosphoesterase family protein, partial [Candidatus Methanoperedens sp.]|nr:metallophosphoesterase family protein [Candidatus Methanoperedens sp.]
HSNIVALKAVIEELDEVGVKIILHAGDIVGYNPYPDETIDLFKKKKIVSILGNHDRAFMTGDTSDFNPYAAAAMEWTRNTASRDSLNYILRLKDTVTIVANGERIVLFHESPGNFQEYIYPGNVTPDLFSNINGDVLVLGHTHIPFIMDYGTRGLVVNPGSVGQPRDGNPDASFAVLNTVTRKIEHKRTKYDVEKVIRDIFAAQLPEALAYRLRAGR